MDTPPNTITELLDSLFGGAVTTLVAGLTGRLMFHVGEVRKQSRKFFGKELLWEVPTAVGMALVAEAACEYIGVTDGARTGVIAALAYLGPRIVEQLFEKFSGKSNGS